MRTLHPPFLEPKLAPGAATLLRPTPLRSGLAVARGGEPRCQLSCGHGRSHRQEIQVHGEAETRDGQRQNERNDL